MIPAISTLQQSLNHFNRAVDSGLRSLADPRAEADAHQRAVDQAGDATGSEQGRGPDQSETREKKGKEPPDPATAAAHIASARSEVRAAIELVRTQDELIGTLLDTHG
jgi:hypothetical protein